MAEFVNKLKEYVTLNMIIYGLIILAVILIISIILRSMKVKKVTKVFEEYEAKYTALKNVPLSFKLNKAMALAKVNKSVNEKMPEYQTKYDEVQESLKEYSAVLADVDDYVFAKKVSKAYETIDELEPIASKCEKQVNDINVAFDELLEQEQQQRVNINSLKTDFRELKRQYNDNRGSYRQSCDYLDDSIKNIENMFSIFEEWMFASEFNKASDKQEDIRYALSNLKNCLDQLPPFYEKACVALPNKEEAIALQFGEAMSKGVYLQHLDVKKNIQLISDMLGDVVSRLSLGSFDNVENTLNDCETRLNQLETSISKECTSFDTINEKTEGLNNRIRDLNVNVAYVRKTYNDVHERFGFETLNPQITKVEENLDTLNSERLDLENMLHEANTPYSTLFAKYEKLDNDTTSLEDEAKNVKEKLDNATSDEQRAKKQLVKLQLLVNEMKTQIMKHRLPSVDEKFNDDIRNANVYIVDVQEILNVTPLNVEALNAKLKEAIDYIYTLYNSVNNLIGMAVMVENAILFGNKYRSDYPEIDSELTRAELCFTNGQYTKALKISISAIEKLHPGAYEKLISASEVGANKNA